MHTPRHPRLAWMVPALLALSSTAMASSPAPRALFFPRPGRTGVAENVIPHALLFYADVRGELKGPSGPVAAATKVDDLGAGWERSLRVVPESPLPPGSYTLDAGDGLVSTFSVSPGKDTTPPGAVGAVETSAEWEGGGIFADGPRVELRLQPPTDDRTPPLDLAYNVYVSPAGAVPDTSGTPDLVALTGEADGQRLRLVISAPGGPVPRRSPAAGEWQVSVRAMDEAGNLGPALAPFVVDVPDGPSCAVGGGGAPGSWLLPVLGLLLACRRARRRSPSASPLT